MKNDNKRKRGAAMVEYSILMFAISMVGLGAVYNLGDQVRTTFNDVTTEITVAEDFVEEHSHEGDPSTDGPGGTADGSAGGSDGGDGSNEEFCPPPSWSWNAARSEYTMPGVGLYHKDSRHSNNVMGFMDENSTVTIGVPASQTTDLFEYSHRHPTYTNRTYWSFVRHVERGDLAPPGENC